MYILYYLQQLLKVNRSRYQQMMAAAENSASDINNKNNNFNKFDNSHKVLAYFVLKMLN